MNNYTDCCLCPRNCHVDRTQGKTGYCGQTDQIRAARAALHMWEEPCISGDAGSGAVFFSGCPLGCVFCQNHSIAAGRLGKTIATERLAEIFLELQDQKAWNINLVTAGHFAPQVVRALELAKGQGLKLPIVYNTSGYEKVETLRMFEGLVDIYLPDFKYLSARTPVWRGSCPGRRTTFPWLPTPSGRWCGRWEVLSLKLYPGKIPGGLRMSCSQTWIMETVNWNGCCRAW